MLPFLSVVALLGVKKDSSPLIAIIITVSNAVVMITNVLDPIPIQIEISLLPNGISQVLLVE
jgi:hypothetical protein